MIKTYPDDTPAEGDLICVSQYECDLYVGIYRGDGVITGSRLPDGYFIMSPGDRWVALDKGLISG